MTRVDRISHSEPLLDLDGLVDRSRRIGADPALVLHGGGNTSTKGIELDWRGRPRRTLRVKGSGTDLATIGPDGFPGLYLDELDALRDREAMTDEEMVADLAHCMREPGGRPPSIETLLHAWLPAAHVDHTHADAICALSNHCEGRAALAEALGPEVAVVPYIRPGFELSRQVAAFAEAEAVVLDHHGLVTWGDRHETSLGRTIDLDARARAYLDRHVTSVRRTARPSLDEAETRALLAALREALSPGGQPVVLHVDRRQRSLADRTDVRRIAVSGRSTPDHVLRIGAQTLVVETAADVGDAVSRFADEYAAYFARHADRLPPGLGMHDPLPRVVLVPGLGCVAAGATARAAQMHADLSGRSHAVVARTLDAFGNVSWLDEQEIFDFDYWPLELRKLAGAPAPAAFAARIAVIDVETPALAEAIACRLRADGALVATSVDAATSDHGGADLVVADTGRLRSHLRRATELLDGAARPTAIALTSDAAAPGETSAVIGAAADPTTAAEAVAFLARDDDRTRGSVVRVGSPA